MRDVPEAARYMPEGVRCGPARPPARLACQSLRAEPTAHDPLSGGLHRDEALAVLEGHDDGARLLLVGHEPDFSQLVHDLTGARIELEKGGVAAVCVGSGEGQLSVLMRPRELEIMAD